MNVAFLGMGRMGREMARHVIEAGHQLTIWNRTPGRARELVAAGAREAASVRDAVAGADAVVLMLFDDASARQVLGDVVAGAPARTLVINTTTIAPATGRDLGRVAATAGLRYVEAPVVGTIGPARDATLRVLVGASEQDAAAAEELLSRFGTTRHVGGVGAATALKAVVNLGLALATGALGEALRLGSDLGVDRDLLRSELAGGALGFILNYKQSMLADNDFQPATFTLDGLIKDLRIATGSARRPLPMATTTLALATEASDAGHGKEDFASLAAYYTAT
ncbi:MULTISPECIES: NAD(P)-dependent oxidoreductase [Protofrankia]|uniref:6-phosphogluconate dehydrogenase NAD-binding protein n=1 Tax=Candidatus Protofrankia datiscae TaxID=2716812 RepID=F8B3R3_9ACTN|nr:MULTISPECIES: NAD(P)-dependent oxidoreductase [Protofrankia]AEH09008.1 6-phosphogluconate dehydrogenase NAD-binding protein [Candidatus Protofrankia datiscae]